MNKDPKDKMKRWHNPRLMAFQPSDMLDYQFLDAEDEQVSLNKLEWEMKIIKPIKKIMKARLEYQHLLVEYVGKGIGASESLSRPYFKLRCFVDTRTSSKSDYQKKSKKQRHPWLSDDGEYDPDIE